TAGILLGLGQVLGITLRRPGSHPLIDEVFLGLGQRHVVLEVPEVRIGMPGWHALFTHNFFDHFGPPGRFFIVLQSKRADLSRAMALHATILKDARDLVGVSDFGGRLGLAHATDQAADRFDRRLAYWLTIEQFIESGSQVFARDARLGVSAAGLESVLIIN